MKRKTQIEERIRGWLPKEPNSNLKRITGRTGLNRKLKVTIIIGILVTLVIGTFFVLTVILWMLNPIVPADVKIRQTLDENRDSLFSIKGVMGAGIARNSSNNYIIGIAVYVENITDVREIPDNLGEFTVFVKRINEVSGIEKEGMIIRREDLQ
jgi:hypothetical protein